MPSSVKELFRQLADLPPEEREKVLLQSQVTPEVRAEVESLLTYDATAGESLARRVSGVAEEVFGSDAAPPLYCGPYRLLRMLGSGGMGVVYLAERRDGEIEQQVAIKVLRADADRPVWRERFLVERQLLAYLNHPYIARLLDAGHTEDGRPYLVMEYVEGTNIDDYAASRNLRTQLGLFLQVCQGISHAHRHLIIHRDLKPSNILVDSSGHPKILDFGIAKLIDVTADETRTLERMLTPNYASPEQLRGDPQSTATDVYSLGAVFYKVMTGRYPREVPATGTTTSPTIPGGNNVVAPSTLNPKIPRDIDYILRKALRDEPEERYSSVDAMAEDVEAFLASRPVQARSGDAWYRTRKFFRRYWVPIVAATLAISGLSIGLWVANRQRGIAERRFHEVRQLSSKFFELDSDIRGVPGTTKARHRIVASSLEYLERLSGESKRSYWVVTRERDLDLSVEIAAAYLQVARVQGVPGHSNLGQFAEAKESLTKADGFVKGVLAVEGYPQHRKALLLSAEIANDLMILAETQTRDGSALGLARKAAGHLDTLMAAENPTREESMAAARLYVTVALGLSNMHHYEEASRYAKRSVEIARRVGVDERQVARGLGVVSNTSRFLGDLDGALQAIRESRAIAERMVKPNDSLLVLTLCSAIWREAMVLGELNSINMGRPQEAIPLLERTLELADNLARNDPDDYSSRSYVSMAGIELGDILRDGQPARALEVYDRTADRLREIKNNPKMRQDEAWLLAGSSYALRRLNRPKEAKQRIDAAFAILRELKAYPTPVIHLGQSADPVLRALADHYADTGQTADAIATYTELLQKVMASNPKPETDLRNANSLARIYRELEILQRRANHIAEADILGRRRLDLWRHWDQKLPNNSFVRRQLAESTVGN